MIDLDSFQRRCCAGDEFDARDVRKLLDMIGVLHNAVRRGSEQYAALVAERDEWKAKAQRRDAECNEMEKALRECLVALTDAAGTRERFRVALERVVESGHGTFRDVARDALAVEVSR